MSTHTRQETARVTECTHCHARVNGATLCPRCTKTLDVALANVSVHHRDLETLRTRSTRYGDGSRGSIGKTMPLGVDLRFASVRRDEAGRVIEGQATEVEQAVRSTVVTWARVLLEEHEPIPGPVCASCLHRSCAVIRRSRHPRDTVASVCSYLQGWVHWIARQAWAEQMLCDLLDAERALARIVDRPAGRWYAGPCNECGKDLYATEGATVVVCRACDWEYDVAPRRDWLLAAAEDEWLPAADLSRAVSWLGGQPLSSDRIYQWKKRGKIATIPERCEACRVRPVVRPCPMDTPLYRVGDAIELMVDYAARRGA